MVYKLTWFKRKGVIGAEHTFATSDEVIVKTTMPDNVFIGKRYVDLLYWLEGKRVSISCVSSAVTFS